MRATLFVLKHIFIVATLHMHVEFRLIHPMKI